MVGAMRRTHRESKTRLFRIWAGMIDRCRRPRNSAWRYYGERGISVCDEWTTSFEAFRDWALRNGYADALTIDRRDSHSGYTSANCQWISRRAQIKARNAQGQITAR
jgi:hypothetical protein